MRFAGALVAALVLVTSARPAAQVTDTASLLAAASRWTARFEQSLSNLLFHEQYRQTITNTGMLEQQVALPVGVHRYVEGNRGSLLTDANVFLLKPANATRFVVYRDVYVANGQKITDHTSRLQDLLVADTAAGRAQAQALTNESARFNVGIIARNTNIPTMLYDYLMPANIGGIRVRPAGRQVLDGRELAVLEFQEIARPTLIRGPDDSDVPASGQYWIDPSSGVVPRAVLHLEVGPYQARSEVTLELHPLLKVWVPREMLEVWQAGSSRINGMARYDNFVRLAVSTEEIVK